jgi:DNA-binding beta-propeller fold protein YncE
MARLKHPLPPGAVRPKPDRLMRAVVLAWVVVGAILLMTLFKVVKAVGLFSFAGSAKPGVCRAMALHAPGDLAFDPKGGLLFIAAAREGAPAASDGLYALKPGSNAPMKLAGTPPDFHPGALGIGYNADGSASLAAVNHHRDGRVSIETYNIVYDAKGATLSYQSSVTGGLARRAQGIAAIGNNRFYVASNPTGSDVMASLDRWFLLGRADVLFFNGQLFREAVNGLSDPTGVAVSPDGQRMFIAARGERRLISLSRDLFTGALTEQDSLSLPMRPERIGIDANGGVWVAGSNRLPSLGGASSVVRVMVGSDGKLTGQETVYADDGEGITSATAAVKTDGHLFIGSRHDDKLLDCVVK